MLSALLLKGRQNLGQRLSASLLPRQQAHREASVACDQPETRDRERAGVVGSVLVIVTRSGWIRGREQEAVGPEQMSRWRRRTGQRTCLCSAVRVRAARVGIKIWGGGVVGTEIDRLDLCVLNLGLVRRTGGGSSVSCWDDICLLCFRVLWLAGWQTETLDVNCGIRGVGGWGVAVMIRATRRARLAHARPMVDPEDSRCSRTR